jgi:hypothetical protein
MAEKTEQPHKGYRVTVKVTDLETGRELSSQESVTPEFALCCCTTCCWHSKAQSRE